MGEGGRGRDHGERWSVGARSWGEGGRRFASVSTGVKPVAIRLGAWRGWSFGRGDLRRGGRRQAQDLSAVALNASVDGTSVALNASVDGTSVALNASVDGTSVALEAARGWGLECSRGGALCTSPADGSCAHLRPPPFMAPRPKLHPRHAHSLIATGFTPVDNGARLTNRSFPIGAPHQTLSPHRRAPPNALFPSARGDL
jgi:hypothetical protein